MSKKLKIEDFTIGTRFVISGPTEFITLRTEGNMIYSYYIVERYDPLTDLMLKEVVDAMPCPLNIVTKIVEPPPPESIFDLLEKEEPELKPIENKSSDYPTAFNTDITTLIGS